MPRIEDIDRFLFIVGAPRCGTTTMARWLQAHPQILFPFVKEPHFFCQHDLRGLEDEELRERSSRIISIISSRNAGAGQHSRRRLLGLLPLRARAA